jgi:hypothetical protein
MAEAAGHCASIRMDWILDSWTLSKRTEFLRGNILTFDDSNQTKFVRLDAEMNFLNSLSRTHS